MKDRAAILAKIKRLRELTAARGCTEAEAMSAATKVAALMQQYGLTDDDLNISVDAAETRVRLRSQRRRLALVIGHVTNTVIVYDLVPGEGYRCLFVGVTPGPLVAAYLRDICERAIDREIRTFKRSEVYGRRRSLSTKRQAVRDFSNAMVNRLATRLLDMFEGAISKQLSDRAAAFRAENFETFEIPLAKARRPRFAGAAQAGWRAGGAVALNHGVGGAPNERTAQIAHQRR